MSAAWIWILALLAGISEAGPQTLHASASPPLTPTGAVAAGDWKKESRWKVKSHHDAGGFKGQTFEFELHLKTTDGTTRADFADYYMEGTMSGNTFTGKTYRGNGEHLGEGVINFNPSARTFSGTWRDKFKASGTWTGTLIWADTDLGGGGQAIGAIRGKLKNPVGSVEVYSESFQKWTRVTGEWVVRAGDRVRTGPDSRCTVFISTPSGAEDRMDLLQNTLAEVPALPAAQGVSLEEGTIRCTVNQARPPARLEPNPFNVRTPTLVVSARGTEFIVRHDAIVKADLVLLREGRLEIKSQSDARFLSPSRQIYVEGGKFSPIYMLEQDTWARVASGRSIPSVAEMKKAKQASVAEQKESLGAVGQPAGVTRIVRFEGKEIETLYQRQESGGRLIDVYYFPIKDRGKDVFQDGEQLWGRFVRDPAAGTPDQSRVQYWRVNWVKKDGRWLEEQSRIGGFEVLGKG
ncbi:FecR domain-containing protein [Fimbriimonadia bacterium ATM]|nr:FecR domain-containing protein [Fimbriimonadia bacterium ATM]